MLINHLLASCSKCFEDCLTLETDLPDFHKLIFIVMKTKHEGFSPEIVKYRPYKNFDNKLFKNRRHLTLKSNTSFDELRKIYMDLLNTFALLNCKYLRANHSKLISKELSKSIILRTRFRDRFLKMKTSEAKSKYNKQRNIYVSLTGKAKRNYYENRIQTINY